MTQYSTSVQQKKILINDGVIRNGKEVKRNNATISQLQVFTSILRKFGLDLLYKYAFGEKIALIAVTNSVVFRGVLSSFEF